VLVRTPVTWAVAVRRPDGEIHSESHAVDERWPRLRRTVLRGPLALADAMRIGAQGLRVALQQSAGVNVTTQQITVTFAPILVAVVAVFVVGPGVLAALGDGVLADVAEAASRPAALLIYLALVARSPQTRRLFAYHGAEHKTIAAFERHGRVPTTSEVDAESPIHVRCGTDFLMLFVIAAGVVYSLVPRRPLWAGGALRIALVPLVAAVAYETMRLAAAYEHTLVARALTWPGRALQRITTRPPEPDQVSVALVALSAAVAEEPG
jgi:uncharacterized protein YqhQ